MLDNIHTDKIVGFSQKNYSTYWVQVWLKKLDNAINQRGYSPRTLDNYRRATFNFLSQFNKHPLKISHQEIETYLLQLAKEKSLSESTYNLHICALQFFFRTVLNTNINSTALIKKKVPEKLPEVFSREELQLIFDNVNGLFEKLLLKSGYAFGLRVNRAIALKLSDFDLKRKTLFVKADKGKKDRLVMLSESFLRDLSLYLNTYYIDDYLFPGSNGEKYITDRTANRILQRAVIKSGIKKKISFHTLRHSFATHLHEDGYSLRDIQYLMGHSNSKTTEKYIKISTRHISKIISPLDRFEGKFDNNNLGEISNNNANFNKRVA